MFRTFLPLYPPPKVKRKTKKSPAEYNRQSFFDSLYSLGVLIPSYKEKLFFR